MNTKSNATPLGRSLRSLSAPIISCAMFALWMLPIGIRQARSDILEYQLHGTIYYFSGFDAGLDGANITMSVRIMRSAAPIWSTSISCCCEEEVYEFIPQTTRFSIAGSQSSDGNYIHSGDTYELFVQHGFCLDVVDVLSIRSKETCPPAVDDDFPIPGLSDSRFYMRLVYHPTGRFTTSTVPEMIPIAGEDFVVVGVPVFERYTGTSWATGHWIDLESIETIAHDAPGDFDLNQQINDFDYETFWHNYCKRVCIGDACHCEIQETVEPLADFDEDGDADLADVAGFQRSFTGIPIVGDFDNNRYVDLFDFAHFHNNYCDWPCDYWTVYHSDPPECNDPQIYWTVCDPPAVPHPRADIDKDGDSDFYDFALFQNAFGSVE